MHHDHKIPNELLGNARYIADFVMSLTLCRTFFLSLTFEYIYLILSAKILEFRAM